MVTLPRLSNVHVCMMDNGSLLVEVTPTTQLTQLPYNTQDAQ